MPGEHRLLIDRFDGDEAHVRLAHCAQDRLRIVAVVLGATAQPIGLDELSGHQPGRVAVLRQEPRPVMRRAAGLQAHEARGQVGGPLGKARETELPEEHRAARGIARTHHDDLLCEVHTDGSNLVHEFPFAGFRLMLQLQSWHFDAVRLTSLQWRGTPFYSLSEYAKSCPRFEPAQLAVDCDPHLREFCVNQSCTVLHCRAFHATGAPANLLMQLMLQFSARD